MANSKKAKMMPNNIDAEQALLGCLLINDKIPVVVMNEVSENDFYSQAHKTIFSCMQDIYRSNRPIDFVTLTDELEKKGALDEVGSATYISALTNAVPSAANYKQYMELVKRDSTLRQLINAGQSIIENSYEAEDKDSALMFAEKQVFDLSQSKETSSLTHVEGAVKEVIDKFNLLARDRDALRGLKTGFYALDKITNGLQKSDLVLVAARPGVGKTSFSMNVINNIALNGGTCAVFSLEMSAAQLMQRAICSVAMVSMSKALKGELNEKEWKLILEAKNKLTNSKIYIDDSALNTPVDILSKCRRIQREHGLDVVMIDYLQLMSTGKKVESRQTEVSEISRALKVAAKELNVPIICLSQLSRAVESRKGGKPVLSDLRESGAIEQDADIVMFLHNPDLYLEEGAVKQGIVDLIIAKHRNGALDTIKLKFISEYTTFANMDKDANDQSLEDSIPNEFNKQQNSQVNDDNFQRENEMKEVSDIDLDELF